MRAVLVVVALLAVGCSGDDGGGDGDGGEAASSTTVTTTATSAPAEEVTGAFLGSACTALATLSSQAVILDQTVAEGDVQVITEAYARTAEVADGLVSQVDTVPAPAVEGGEAIKAAVLAAWEAAAAAVRSAESAVRSAAEVGEAAGVDTATIAVAEEGAQAVAGVVDGLRSTLSSLSTDFPDASAEITEALEHEHDCEGLTTE